MGRKGKGNEIVPRAVNSETSASVMNLIGVPGRWQTWPSFDGLIALKAADRRKDIDHGPTGKMFHWPADDHGF